jgi:hypothetical protein
VEVSGTWFSGHSALARGFYQDKSTARSLNHHLKLLLKSPSFKDITTNLQLYRDDNEFKIDFKVKKIHRNREKLPKNLKPVKPNKKPVQNHPVQTSFLVLTKPADRKFLQLLLRNIRVYEYVNFT